jgi:hypothetical protein
LRKIFNRCRRYGISLNPKKSIFAVNEGKLLGFVVSKDGIMIEPKELNLSQRFHFPIIKKSMQSYFSSLKLTKFSLENNIKIKY